MTYAIVVTSHNGVETVIEEIADDLPTDEAARRWHQGAALPGSRLVVLDLDDGDHARPGRVVEVDDEGVATLVP